MEIATDPRSDFTPRVIALPRDSNIPRHKRGADGTVVRGPLPAADPPLDGEEERVWFRWVVGHQHLFFYWIVQADLGRRIRQALEDAQLDRAARRLRHLASLRRGEIAAMLNCGDLASPLYQSVLRPRMVAIRADFSARSAQDYVAMETEMDRLGEFLRDPSRESESLAAAHREYRDACTAWKQHHIEVAERLQPGASLAVQEYRRQRAEGLEMSFSHYVAAVIQSTEAMAQYDRFFGIERASMSIDELASTATWVVSQAHRLLLLPLEPLVWLMRGDQLLLAHLDRALRATASDA